MATKRTVTREDTRVAGEGSDGGTYGVTSLRVQGGNTHGACKKPCATCPWRKDAEIGRFPAQAFRESAHTSHDASMALFACHEKGELGLTCAGFLLTNAQHNIGIRLAEMMGKLDLSRVKNPDKVPLYKGYREMAVANGVDPDDPCLEQCRGDNEPSPYERRRRAERNRK